MLVKFTRSRTTIFSLLRKKYTPTQHTHVSNQPLASLPGTRRGRRRRRRRRRKHARRRICARKLTFARSSRGIGRYHRSREGKKVASAKDTGRRRSETRGELRCGKKTIVGDASRVKRDRVGGETERVREKRNARASRTRESGKTAGRRR